MKDRQIFLYTIIASSMIHVAVLGSMGSFWDLYSANPIPKTQVIELKQKQAPLLPEIRMIGEFKQLSKASDSKPKPQDTSLNQKVFMDEISAVEPESLQTKEQEKEIADYVANLLLFKDRLPFFLYEPLPRVHAF